MSCTAIASSALNAELTCFLIQNISLYHWTSVNLHMTNKPETKHCRSSDGCPGWPVWVTVTVFTENNDLTQIIYQGGMIRLLLWWCPKPHEEQWKNFALNSWTDIIFVFIHFICSNSRKHSSQSVSPLQLSCPYSQTLLWERRNQLIKTTPAMHLIFLLLLRCWVFFQRLGIFSFFFFSLTNFWQMFYCLWQSWQRGIVVYLDGPDPRQAGSNLKWCPGRLMPNTHGEANCHRHTTHDTASSQPGRAHPTWNTEHCFLVWFSLPVLILYCLLCHMFPCYCVFATNFYEWWMKIWCRRKYRVVHWAVKQRQTSVKNDYTE